MTSGDDSTDLRLLGWLRAAPGPVSGADLARRLGCSRAAVWKRIAALRERGYRITARRSAGYVLAGAPDRIGPAELAPHLTGTWRTVHWFAEVDSTMRVARDLARGGATEGTVVIAEAQTAGRGRLGRQWHSPAGTNLYCSIILRPPVAPPAVPQLALVAGVAAADAIAASTGERPAIKWPNDVLLRGRKVVGILTEMDAEVERVGHVVAGIGVNLNAPAASFPRALRAKAGSLLSLTGRRVDRAAFAARLLAAFEECYARFLAAGLAGVRAEWESYSCLTGRTVTVTAADGDVTGRALGLDDDGALRLEAADGSVRRVLAGEVTVRDGYAGADG